MRKFRKGFILPAMFLITGILFAADNSAKEVNIDFKMDVAKENYSVNYFNWTVGDGEPVQDKFDTVSGASLKGSTKAFNAVRFSGPAEEKKAAIPSGLRGLFLFAVSDWNTVQDHALQVTKKSGIITVRFIRKGTAYELKTDKKGNFDLLTGSKCAKNIADKNENGFVIKSEYLKDGSSPDKMTGLDWEKIELKSDTYNPEASCHYEGFLKFNFENNILSIYGTMKNK